MVRNRIIRTLTREAGLASAVLALWMLALLAPLHQTSGMLRAFGAAGVEISASWSICIADEAAQSDHAIPSCPAQAIGKDDLATPPGAVVAARLGHPAPFLRAGALRSPPRATPEQAGQQPRAPPHLA